MDGTEKYSEGKSCSVVGECEIRSDQWFDSEGLSCKMKLERSVGVIINCWAKKLVFI